MRFSHKYDYSEKKPANVERMLGRTYSDYGKWVEAHPDANLWQYDSVEGKATDRKAILTITYPEFRFRFGYLISKGNARSVLRKFKALCKLLGARCGEVFECNLSVNGCEFARYVIPKGKSLDGLTQTKVDLLLSHINSHVRGSNENRTPYGLMAARFGEGFMEAIEIKRVPPKEVRLKPSLLK